MFKTKFLVILVCLLANLGVFAQQDNWVLPNNQLFFNGGTITQASLPGANYSSTNLHAAYNGAYKNGALQFYIVENEIFEANGEHYYTLPTPGAANGISDYGSEMAIVPVPNETDAYFVVYETII